MKFFKESGRGELFQEGHVKSLIRPGEKVETYEIHKRAEQSGLKTNIPNTVDSLRVASEQGKVRRVQIEPDPETGDARFAYMRNKSVTKPTRPGSRIARKQK